MHKLVQEARAYIELEKEGERSDLPNDVIPITYANENHSSIRPGKLDTIRKEQTDRSKVEE